MLTRLLFASTCALASLCFITERALADPNWRCTTNGSYQAYGSTQAEAYNSSLLQCASQSLQTGECQPRNVVCQPTGIFTPQPQLPQPQPPQAIRVVPLKSYWSSQRKDHFTLATQESESAAVAAGYKFVRVEACIFQTQRPGTVPLESYYSPQRREHFTTGTQESKSSAIAAGYRFVRIEGYVYPSFDPNKVTYGLDLYWNAQRSDNFTLMRWSESAPSATQAGYVYVRTEGWTDHHDFKECKGTGR